MGNIIGYDSDKQFKKIYKNINSELISDNLSYEKIIDNKINAYKKYVKIPEISNIETIDITTEDNFKLLNLETENNSEINNMSVTSPFISPDMYNYFMSNKQKGGADMDDSSSSDEKNSEEKTVDEINMSMEHSSMENKEDQMRMPDSTPNSNHDMRGLFTTDQSTDVISNNSNISFASYLSSSENKSYVKNSEKSSDVFSSDNNSKNISSINNTSISINNKILSESINTSDINMISVEH